MDIKTDRNNDRKTEVFGLDAPEQNQAGPSGPRISSAAREVAESLKDVFRAEARLAISEVKQTGKSVGRHAALGGAFGAIAVLGVLPIIAFLVVGLGRLLNDNYWLSSLIVGLVMIGIGGVLARSQFKRLAEEEYNLPHTRRTLDESVHRLSSNVRRIADFKSIKGGQA